MLQHQTEGHQEGYDQSQWKQTRHWQCNKYGQDIQGQCGLGVRDTECLLTVVIGESAQGFELVPQHDKFDLEVRTVISG